MALSIKDEYTDQLAREVAKLAGESITKAITGALEIRRSMLLKAQERRRKKRYEAVRQIQADLAAAPVYDPRSIQKIMDDMYDEYGLPK